jgi:replicative DNA helicase
MNEHEISLTLPSSLKAEQAILGALLYNNLLYERIAYLRPQHFYNPLHSKIFETIVDMINRGQLATPITIAPIFQKDPQIIELGGDDYWVDLVSLVGPISHLASNGKYMYDLFLRRELIKISEKIEEKAKIFESDKNCENLIEAVEVDLFNLASTGQQEKRAKSLSSSLAIAIEQASKASKKSSLVGVTTGLADVDSHLGGMHPSDLIILAGRPSMGKTALATSIGFNAAKENSKNPESGAKVLFFSLEMSCEQLALRILGNETGISSDRIRKGAINHKEFITLEEKAKELNSVPFFIDDTAALTMAGIRTRARRLKRQENIGMIIIDYLQLISSGKSENRVQELTEITRGLKALAKEINVPVIALSQLSRAVEQREDKQPQLSDLRESGSIEQDSDVVMFVYRQAYYEARKKPQSGSDKMQEWQLNMSKIYNLADLIIAKQRHGPIGTIHLHFDENTTKFSNLGKDTNF